MPKVNDFLFGKKGKNKQITTQTPEQQNLLKLITEGLQGGDSSLSDIFGNFDKGAFEEGVSKPAIKQFQEEILPMIQEKFIAGNQALGSGNQRAQLKAGSDLQSKLAQLMYQAQQSHQQNRLQGVNTALGTKAFENVYQPGTEGAVQGFVKGAGQGLGEAVGGGIPGAASSVGNFVKGIIAG